MGHLAYSADMCSSHLEAQVPTMIQSAIQAVLAPIHEEMRVYIETLHFYGERLDGLAAKVDERERQ